MARSERDVKLAAKRSTMPFNRGQILKVLEGGRHTALVEYFDGRRYSTARIEVCAEPTEEEMT